MELLDWLVLCGTLGFIVGFGIWKTRAQRDLSSFLKGGNSDKWYTVGLSVMATQASAITFLSATGQGFASGMGFVQIYLGLPLAIILICAVFIPIYYRLNVYTAYEYLENRFDLKTRLLTASLFLISRAFAAGITIYAPSIVLSALFEWDLQWTNVAIGVLVILYTVSGGTKAVSVTQKQQMAVIFAGMFIAFFLLIDGLPKHVSLSDGIYLADLAGRMDPIDLSFDPSTRYTLWSGLLGGFFLSLSYFGTDQSQVQRYITATDTTQSRMGLIFNALLKIPMQFFILFVGVLMFVFYTYNELPMYFNEQQIIELKDAGHGATVDSFQRVHRSLHEAREIQANATLESSDAAAAYQRVNREIDSNKVHFQSFMKEKLPDADTKDTDYVFLTYILNHFPSGLIGLLLAVIMSAAMSSTSGELNALTSTAVVDYYKRLKLGKGSDKGDLRASRLFTLFWGVLAIGFALGASLFENLIQLVNIIGSLFYGTILGVFICGFFLKQLKARHVFWAAVVAELCVIGIFLTYDLSYLWLNPIGSALVIALAFGLKFLNQREMS